MQHLLALSPAVDWLLAGTALLFALCWLSNTQRLRRTLVVMASQQAEIERLQQELRALGAGAAGMSATLARLEQQFKRLQERQDELAIREPSEQVYELATRLARSGAGIEEIMNRCGLVRDEAELLLRVNAMRDSA